MMIRGKRNTISQFWQVCVDMIGWNTGFTELSSFKQINYILNKIWCPSTSCEIWGNFMENDILSTTTWS